MQVTNIRQNQWLHATGKWESRPTNGHKETFEDDGSIRYLDYGASFMGVLMSNLIKKDVYFYYI